ncbi:protein 60A-like [Bacillus rossius redtenbacheri]|uniref:protein 60A-like n=1 Tax=Bacillus rossius redtenbacheri TaxID=93214 RepID=UPI002FDCA9F0
MRRWLLRGAAAVVVVVAAALSGLYADDGTATQRALSPSDKRLLERELLGLLGLRARPRVPRRADLAGSASRFLLAVYDYTSLAPADRLAVDRSDAVVSFAAHATPDEGLSFDVSGAPAGLTAVSAQLRLYHAACRLHPGVALTVSLHQLAAPGASGTERRLVDSVETSCAHEGWLSLNATGPFTAWASSPESNLGLHVSARLATRPGLELRPEEAGVLIAGGEPGRAPFLVAFLRSSPRRGVPDEGPSPGTPWQASPRGAQLHWGFSTGPCRVSSMKVNFSELQWNDWVIAPRVFDASACRGDCSDPADSRLRATNHAVVQMLVHLGNSSRAPAPCCAPARLAPMSILYRNDENTVTVRNYLDMIVRACGCL